MNGAIGEHLSVTDWDACRITVVIPTYNESDNLPQIVARLRAAAPEVDILVVDDNSPDGTGKLADEIASEDEAVHVLHRTEKAGLGAASTLFWTTGLCGSLSTFSTLCADAFRQARAGSLICGSAPAAPAPGLRAHR